MNGSLQIEPTEVRCDRCTYYVCVCHGAKSQTLDPPVNHVEALSARILHATSGNPGLDLDSLLTLRRGEWSTEVLVVSKSRKTPHCLKLNRHSASSTHYIQNEMEALKRVSKRSHYIHNLLYFYEQCSPTNLTHLVFEFVGGGELVKHIQSNGLLEVGVIKLYTLQLYSALQCVHSQYILHRDVKPSNLLLTTTGNIKLTGFSLAKIVHDRTYSLCGTAQYIAPEMLQRDGYSRSVDWWSFGVVLFELAFGHTPFERKNELSAKELILAIEGFQAIEKPSWCPDERLWDVISKILITDIPSRIGFVKDLHKHTFYRYFNNKRLEYNKIQSNEIEMPFIPRRSNSTDASGYFTANFVDSSLCT